jgi:3D (Asp-Asp-Asp) domain-containing protein
VRLFPVLLIVVSLTGCARRLPQYERPLARTRIQCVRTTAYTDSESDHKKYGQASAQGTRLRYDAIHSAAADWARWPCGTRFRIVETGELCQVDDYGWALAGTNTIDLYKPSFAAMNGWGVHRVHIEILEWGDPWQSYRHLKPVKRYRHVARMMWEIRRFY